jgi:hypothetical protein
MPEFNNTLNTLVDTISPLLDDEDTDSIMIIGQLMGTVANAALIAGLTPEIAIKAFTDIMNYAAVSSEKKGPLH